MVAYHFSDVKDHCFASFIKSHLHKH